jgi:branched-chain amino acid aminotransferase
VTGIFPDGEGIFETIKTTDGLPFALTRHIARATRSARKIGLPIPSGGAIRQAIAHEISQSAITTRVGRLRVCVLPSGEVDVTHENYQRWTFPARLTIIDRPIDEEGKMMGVKALPYRENIACLDFAQSSGFDDGIRLNKQGRVCESAVANLLLQIDGTWCTPNLASGCLPGIMRELAIEWFKIRERSISLEDLARADAVFLLSSLKDAQPVSSLDDRTLQVESAFMAQLTRFLAQDIDP